MENPASWGDLEKAIYEACQKFDQNERDGLIGLSMVRVIADKLREKGLVK